MSTYLTKRISFRWKSNSPSETTDTLVMTSGDWFVDIRMNKAEGSIDWAFAGERKTLRTDDDGLTTYQWIHLIDSKGSTADDIGTLSGSREGDYLETGVAPHSDTNVSTEYEEVWRDVPITNESGFGCAVVLQIVDGNSFIGWFGDVFQILCDNCSQSSETQSFFARREAWNEETLGWVTVYTGGEEAGKLSEYSARKLSGHVQFKEQLDSGLAGGEVLICGERWIIRAITRFTEDIR